MKSLLFIALFLTLAARSYAAPALPPNLKWETNTAEPLIGDPAALKGGTFNTYIEDYPLTFRVYGPNSNDMFAAWNRSFTLDFVLVMRHPITDHYIPWLATDWAVMDDHRTLYFKLDPAARWSDGQPVTADDYVFGFQMMGSKEIVDPTANLYAQTYFESVEAIDPYTLKIVGKRPSWRPLDDYAILPPMPRHAITLGPNWVTGTNNTPQVAIGPYVVTHTVAGQEVTFERQKNWWGENRRYFKGLYNVDKIVVRVIPDDRLLDYFQNGEIDYYNVNTARLWAEKMDFPAMRMGWTHRKRVFVDMPEGFYGLAMNLEVPIFQNKDFRKALQYLFNFDAINNNMMYGAYYRLISTFTGTEYANPDLKPYGFNPYKAREYLVKAGYARRGPDGILVNARGEPARFTIIYGTKGIEPHLIVQQQYWRHFGIDARLKLLEGGAAFNRALERKYEMTVVSYTTTFYPEPYQYFHSDFLKTTNNNNIWAFGRPGTDKLIDVYRFDMNKQARLDAMWKLDATIQDEAFYIPWWTAPYTRMIYWDKLCWPKYYLPKRTGAMSELTDWQVYWIDPAREKALAAARAANKPLPPDPVIDVDAWGVKAALEAKDAAARK